MEERFDGGRNWGDCFVVDGWGDDVSVEIVGFASRTIREVRTANPIHERHSRTTKKSYPAEKISAFFSFPAPSRFRAPVGTGLLGRSIYPFMLAAIPRRHMFSSGAGGPITRRPAVWFLRQGGDHRVLGLARSRTRSI